MKKLLLALFIISLFSCSEKPFKKFEIYDKVKGDIKEKDEQSGLLRGNDQSKSLKDKKIIRNARIVFSVNDFSGIEEKVTVKVKQFDGYIASSSLSGGYYTLEVRIPEGNLDNFLKTANDFGKITAKSISSEDVTEQYFDLEERIKNKQIQLDKIRKYLPSAKNIDEILKVENELNRLTNELESLEGSFKRLSNNVTYSSVNLEFNLPFVSKNNSIISITNGLNDVLYFIVNFFIVLLLGIFYFLIVAVPAIFIVGGIYYLCFGKIGLMKKFFKLLSDNKGRKK